jgi:prepilin-type N-terminal cleavage/methylation domain-containing protein
MKIIKKNKKGFTLLELLAVLIVIAMISIGVYELYSHAKENYIISSDFDNISGIMDKIIDAEGGSLQPGGSSCAQGCGFNDFATSLGSSSYQTNMFSNGLVPSDMTDGKTIITNSLKSPIYFYSSTGTDTNGNTYPSLIASSSGYDATTCIGLVQRFKDKYYQAGKGSISINGTAIPTANLTTATILSSCSNATAPITIQVWYNRILGNS